MSEIRYLVCNEGEVLATIPEDKIHVVSSDHAMVVSKRALQDFMELMWGMDIPSATCPEYIEWHQGMIKLSNYMHDNIIKGEVECSQIR